MPNLILYNGKIYTQDPKTPEAGAIALRDGKILAIGEDAAVTRQRRDGTPAGGWQPSQKLTVPEAIWGYTMGSALASGQEKKQGSLSPGKLADLIVLDRDILSIDPAEIFDTQVLMTVFDGEIVYQAQ